MVLPKDHKGKKDNSPKGQQRNVIKRKKKKRGEIDPR